MTLSQQEHLSNQDTLENFFSQLRQCGVRYTNPPCKAFGPFDKLLTMKNFCSIILVDLIVSQL